MFADDPELEAIRKLTPDAPERKPIWWQIVQGVLMVAGVGAAWGLQLALGTRFHPLVPISGALAGGLLAMAIFGYRPGRYQIIETDEKLTLWVKLPPLWRAGAGVGALAVVAGAIALANAQDDTTKPSTPKPASTTPAKPTKK